MRHREVGQWVWWLDGLILVAVAGGLAWAVPAGERESAAYLAMLGWFLLLGLVVPRNTPEACVWTLVLIAVGCGGAAVGFFRLYEWAGWPVMAYVDAISTGLVSLLAVLNLWVKSVQRSRPSPGLGEAGGRGEPHAVGRE